MIGVVAGLVAVVAATPACRSGAPKVAKAERLVIASFDGMGADLAWQWIEDGVTGELDGLAGMARHGMAARRMRPVDPTLTSVNHVSLIAGAYPERTGVVSNVFHRRPGPLTETVSGFSAGIEAETLCESVRRQGGRVGVLLWPGVTEDNRAEIADFGLHWPSKPLVPSEVLELEPGTAEVTGELPAYDAVAPLLWRVPIRRAGAGPGQRALAELLVAATDATPDGRPHYDTVGLRLDLGPEAAGHQTGAAGSWALLSELEWSSVELEAHDPNDPTDPTDPTDPDEARHRYGSWCKVLRVDRYTGEVRMLRGAFYRLLAYPEALATDLEQQVGFWPGPPDDTMVEHWWVDAATGIDLDTYLEQILRLEHYLDSIAQWVMAHEQFRLLLVYHPSPDEYEHTSLIVEPSQWAYSPGRALAAREGLRQVGASVDHSVALLWHALDPVQDALVVLSDHGLMPVHDVVRVNQALADAGLVHRTDSGRQVAADTPMLAHCSGATAQVYLADSVVGTPESVAMLERAARALADIFPEDPGTVTGPVVEQVLRRSEASALGLDHPSSGDLLVFLAPGYKAVCDLGEAVIEPATSAAQHGFLSHHPGMQASFFARGGVVGRSTRDEVRVPEVAHRIAGWLDVPPPGLSARLRGAPAR